MAFKTMSLPGAHKYVVFLSAFACMALSISYLHSFGRLFAAIMERFHCSRAEAAVIQSTSVGVFLVIGLLTGLVVQRFGPRTSGMVGALVSSGAVSVSFLASSVSFLVVTHGICLGIGGSLIFISSSTVVGQLFQGKTKLLALSVLSCGSGVGGMFFPYLLDGMLTRYGLQGTFLVAGGLLSNAVAFSLLWCNDNPTKKKKSSKSNLDTVRNRHVNLSFTDSSKDINSNNNGLQIMQSQSIGVSNENGVSRTQIGGRYKRKQSLWMIERVYSQFKPKDTSSHKHGKLRLSLSHVLAVKPFVFCTLGLSVANPANNLFRILFVDTMNDVALSNSDISFGLLLLNICSSLGRLSVGGIQQWSRVSPFFVPLVGTLLGAGGMSLMITADTFFMAMLVCCLNGIAQGIVYSSFTVTSARLVGSEYLPTAVGLIFSLNAIGCTIAAPISGYIRDTMGSYNLDYISSAVSMATGGVILVGAQLIARRMKKPMSRKVSIYVTKL